MLFSVGLALLVVGLFLSRVVDDGPLGYWARGGVQTRPQAFIGWVVIVGGALVLLSLCILAWRHLP